MANSTWCYPGHWIELGRSLIDLLDTLNELETSGVALVLHQQTIDTTTPAGRMFFQVTGAFAEFERAMIRSRVTAGLDRARARGVRLGRPRTSAKVEAIILSRLKAGQGVKKVAKAAGVGNGTVSRIKATMAAMGRSLEPEARDTSRAQPPQRLACRSSPKRSPAHRAAFNYYRFPNLSSSPTGGVGGGAGRRSCRGHETAGWSDNRTIRGISTSLPPSTDDRCPTTRKSWGRRRWIWRG